MLFSTTDIFLIIYYYTYVPIYILFKMPENVLTSVLTLISVNIT